MTVDFAVYPLMSTVLEGSVSTDVGIKCHPGTSRIIRRDWAHSVFVVTPISIAAHSFKRGDVRKVGTDIKRTVASFGYESTYNIPSHKHASILLQSMHVTLSPSLRCEWIFWCRDSKLWARTTSSIRLCIRRVWFVCSACWEIFWSSDNIKSNSVPLFYCSSTVVPQLYKKLVLLIKNWVVIRDLFIYSNARYIWIRLSQIFVVVTMFIYLQLYYLNTKRFLRIQL